MLKKRIIPCLDIKDGRTVKGINFVDIRDAGDPVELAKRYVEQRADELVFLDITATIEKRKTFASLVGRIADEINLPFTVGGGINTLEDVALLIKAGADKVSINSSAFRTPELIKKIAGEFGSQCVVVAIDTRYDGSDWMVYLDGGRTPTGAKASGWAREAERLGAGEILLTSMNADGTKSGFSLDITGEKPFSQYSCNCFGRRRNHETLSGGLYRNFMQCGPCCQHLSLWRDPHTRS